VYNALLTPLHSEYKHRIKNRRRHTGDYYTHQVSFERSWEAKLDATLARPDWHHCNACRPFDATGKDRQVSEQPVAYHRINILQREDDTGYRPRWYTTSLDPALGKENTNYWVVRRPKNWGYKFLCKMWLNMNKELEYQKIKNCGSRTHTRKYLRRVERKWENKVRVKCKIGGSKENVK
jgi:hypothetical protein